MKILSIVGARPQFIKAALVTKKLREKGIEEALIHTGQHYDFNMSDVFFNELNLPKPDYYLDIGSGSHGEQTGKMLIEIENVLLKEKPDMILVYGDTNTTLASALSAAKLHIPIAHIEAGLRSYNKRMPEEINRVLTDHMCDILFAPTDIAVVNLRKEGVRKGIYQVGDVMYDLALEVKGKFLGKENDFLSRYSLESKRFILATIHRAENTDIKDNLENIWDALIEVAKNRIKVFFPVHPRTKKMLEKFNLLQSGLPENLVISEPVGYTDMVVLESNARLIITDSGGVQKEGYFFKTPCVVPRNETEWVELVDAGWNNIVGNKKENIINAVLNGLNEDFEDKKWIDFYGNGDASEKIIKIIEKRLNSENMY